MFLEYSSTDCMNIRQMAQFGWAQLFKASLAERAR